mgnify:CR=1 FL=1
MKKTLFLVLVMVLSSVLGSNSFAADRAHTLKVYNWADYVSMDVLDEFPAWYYEQTGEQVEVLLQTFDINEAMLAEIEVGHEDYDVICPSEYIIERMLRNQLLQPINKDFGSTPDYTTSVSSFAVEKFQQMAPDSTTSVADYAVGYMWGTTGFIYNPSLVSKSEILSIGCLNNEKFRRKILMKDAFRDIYSLFVLYVYQDEINRGEVTRDELVANVTEERIQRVEEFILSMKDNIAGWEVDFGKEEMIKGRAWINVSWSGDANWAIDEAAQVGVTLDYILPKEGSSVWFDGWCIPIYAKNTKAASYFINYMCMPQNAIRNMEEVGYVSVISSPEVLAWANDENIHETVDLTYFFGKDAEAVHANKVLYPDQSVIEYCSLMHDCGDMTEPMLAMWSRVKGDNLSIGMLIFIVIALVMSVIFCVLKVLSKKKQKRVYSKKNSNKKNTTTKMLLTIGLSWISIAAFPNAASAEEYENNLGISIEGRCKIEILSLDNIKITLDQNCFKEGLEDTIRAILIEELKGVKIQTAINPITNQKEYRKLTCDLSLKFDVQTGEYNAFYEKELDNWSIYPKEFNRSASILPQLEMKFNHVIKEYCVRKKKTPKSLSFKAIVIESFNQSKESYVFMTDLK